MLSIYYQHKMILFIGIKRIERWERALKYDLNPPQIVQTILKKYADNQTEIHERFH